MRRMMSPRFGMGVANQAEYAALAASTASSTSAPSLQATSPSTSSRSAGLRSTIVRPDRAGTQLPPMKFMHGSLAPMAPLDRAAAEALDASDPLAPFRSQFLIGDEAAVYVDGNSLG